MNSPVIKPTISRRVWFRPSAAFLASNPILTQFNPEQPMDAGIVYVHHDHMVNLIVTDHVGKTLAVPSVPLLAGHYVADEDTDMCCCCEWMPYQKSQAAKTEVADEAPRVTPAALKDEIVSEHYFTAADGARMSPDGNWPIHKLNTGSLGLLTFCALVLRNGFTVYGASACASPENFNAEIGRRIARENAEREIWPLMGYELRSKLAA